MSQTSALQAFSLQCAHETLSEGFCTICGIKCDQLFEDQPSTTSTAEKSIMKDLDNLPVPDFIKRKANEVFLKLNSVTKKGNRRRQLIFFCLNSAYAEEHIPIDPKTVAEMVGIPASEMTRALSAFSEAQTGYHPVQQLMLPTDFIPVYCRELNFTEETIADVVQFAHGILKKDPELIETYPQKVAAGILLYYCNINGVDIDRDEYARMIKLSVVTIANMAKAISLLDNTVPVGGKHTGRKTSR